MTPNKQLSPSYTLNAYTTDGTVNRNIDLGFWAAEKIAIRDADSVLSKLPDGVRATLYRVDRDATYVARIFDGTEWR